MGVAKADRKLMREINSMTVLQRVRDKGPISRTELAEQIGLGLSTISNIVGELLENYLIREVGEGDSSGGRRPGLLDINESAKYAFGVKIGPGTAWIALFDLRARSTMQAEVSFRKEDPQELFALVEESIQQMRNRARIPKRSILGIGISASGLINRDSGSCVYSPILGWQDVAIREHIASRTKLDVVVENDVNAFAYGTYLQEQNQKNRNLICITTGPGVGAGIILDGRLYRGANGGAGEFGHMSIDRNGTACPCGRNGCLDVLGSDQYLLARATEVIERGESLLLKGLLQEHRLSPATIRLAAEIGDASALSMFQELGQNLGHGVANLINLFNPDKIVIGGEGATAAKFFLPSLRETALKSAFPHLADDLTIVIDDGSEDVWLQGAAELVIERFFAVPLASA